MSRTALVSVSRAEREVPIQGYSSPATQRAEIRKHRGLPASARQDVFDRISLSARFHLSLWACRWKPCSEISLGVGEWEIDHGAVGQMSSGLAGLDLVEGLPPPVSAPRFITVVRDNADFTSRAKELIERDKELLERLAR